MKTEYAHVRFVRDLYHNWVVVGQKSGWNIAFIAKHETNWAIRRVYPYIATIELREIADFLDQLNEES